MARDRALYLAAGAIDVAVETGDAELLEAVRRQYDRTLQRRTYLHGGMGSNHHGESFGDDFELPSERAYAETCAAVASVQVAWRLLLATGDEQYADVIERTLLNTVLAAPSLDGNTFFSVNALQRREPSWDPADGMSLRRTDGQRAPWFTTSCCPTNLARLLASFTAYVATTSLDALQLHQYVDGRIETTLGRGSRVGLRVRTAYPVDGVVRIEIDRTEDEEWALELRVPAWSSRTEVVVAGGPPEEVPPGRHRIHRRWRVGDVVELRLDFAARAVRADPRVDALRGQVAIERGPLIYCVESVDQPGLDLDTVLVDSTDVAEGSCAHDLLDLPTLTIGATSRAVEDVAWPYSPDAREHIGAVTRIVMVPYFVWANRGSSTMRVWLPEAPCDTSTGERAEHQQGDARQR